MLVFFTDRLSEWIFILSIVTASLRRVIVLGVGAKLYPLQVVAGHEGAGVSTAGSLLTFGDELHAVGFFLLFVVEVFEVCHAHGVMHIAEVAEAFDVDALALAHAGVHHVGDVAQHGLHVTVALWNSPRR